MRELWAEGYTRSELDAAQDRFGLRFPPDLVELFLDRRPLRGWDWRTDEAGIRDMLRQPLEGLLFDVEHNALWWPEWGERPASEGERAEIVTGVVASAPRLIPIIAHRFIPETPHEAGNPVFSVMQSDIIYYGANLADFFERQFHLKPYPREPVWDGVKFIPLWSEFVMRWSGADHFFGDGDQR